MTTAENDAARREYNAAVANGHVMRARVIERRMNAILRAERRPPGSGDTSG